MRTVHENYNNGYEEQYDFLIKDLPEQAEMYRELLRSYCHELKERMTDDGVLISIERIGRDALLLGWMEALHDQDLSFDLDWYTEIKTKEVDEEDELLKSIYSFLDETRAKGGTVQKLQ